MNTTIPTCFATPTPGDVYFDITAGSAWIYRDRQRWELAVAPERAELLRRIASEYLEGNA